MIKTLLITLIESIIFLQICKIYPYSHEIGFVLIFVLMLFIENITETLENLFHAKDD